MRAIVKSYQSKLTDEQMVRHIEGQDALAHAFANVQPTKRLIKRCYSALAAAGVEPLPVKKKRIVKTTR